MRRPAIAALLAPLLCAAAPVSPAVQPPASLPGQAAAAVPWPDVAVKAARVVAADGTAAALPFAMPSAAARAASPRRVFAYYFPFFLISMDDAPPDRDHWAAHYLQRSGEGGKYAAQGGFTRQRPLPAGPWSVPYWRAIDEAIDVLRAQAIGIDGFGVGIEQPRPSPTYDIARGVCAAASAVAPGFTAFPEPDGGTLRTLPAADMAALVADFATCPATLRLADGHGMLAPFAPENEPVDYWRDVLARLDALGHPADFVPVLLDPGRFARPFAPISAGISFWGWRDPASMASPPAQALMQWLPRLTPIWMQPVTPQDSRPKDAMFWESHNTEAFRNAWMQAISSGARYAHIVTWNDYSEATELAPSSATQFVFYDLTAYYGAWFKTGHPPTIIRDAIYYTHRTQVFVPDHPPAAGDVPFRRFGATPLHNDVEMLAMLTAPATIEIALGGRSVRAAAGPGLTALTMPAAAGRPVFRVWRDGRVALEQRSDWTIDAHAGALSALYAGGSSTRPHAAAP